MLPHGRTLSACPAVISPQVSDCDLCDRHTGIFLVHRTSDRVLGLKFSLRAPRAAAPLQRYRDPPTRVNATGGNDITPGRAALRDFKPAHVSSGSTPAVKLNRQVFSIPNSRHTPVRCREAAAGGFNSGARLCARGARNHQIGYLRRSRRQSGNCRLSLRRLAQALRRRRQVNKPAEQAHQANHAAHCLGPA